MKREQWEDAIGKIDPAYVREAEQWKKLSRRAFLVKRVLPMAACICVLLTGAAFGWNYLFDGGSTGDTCGVEMAAGSPADRSESAQAETADAGDERENTKTSVEDEEEAAQTTTAENVQDKTTESAESLQGGKEGQEDDIFINSVDQLNTVCIDIGADHEEQFGAEQAQEYYGVKVLPEQVPEGLDFSKEQTFTVAYSKSGEVVRDENTFSWRSEDGSMQLDVNVRTVDSGMITEVYEDDLKVSKINGTEVNILQYTGEDVAGYVAIFEKEGVTFTVSSKNLTEEAVLAVLQELCGEQQER